MKIEEALHTLLMQKNSTLSVAESCTGGSLSSRITKQAGASHYFLGGVIAYSNALKIDLLDVLEKEILEKGAVSFEVAKAMCIGIQKKTHSTYALSITGIAGPSGGSTDKPVGTIWAALMKKGEDCEVWQFFIAGERLVVIEKAVDIVLERLYFKLYIAS